jgi:hypothetical protein
MFNPLGYSSLTFASTEGARVEFALPLQIATYVETRSKFRRSEIAHCVLNFQRGGFTEPLAVSLRKYLRQVSRFQLSGKMSYMH